MGIQFFKKNKIDLDQSGVSITITDATATNTGETFANQIRNRKNNSGWATSDSNDAANTTMEIDMAAFPQIDHIKIVDHNLKAFTVKYWNGSAWTDFSTPISETTNTLTTNSWDFTSVEAQKLQLIITGTMVADDDKFVAQIIATEKLGEFTLQPDVTRGRAAKNRRTIDFISGKARVTRNEGFFQCRMRHKGTKDDTDLSLIETLHDIDDGFLVYLGGGTVSQFPNERVGWRLKDIYLMNIESELNTSWKDGHFDHGMEVDFNLIEVI